MVDPVTTNRSLAQPTRGSDVGTWDVPVNGNMGLLDTILGGIATIAMPSGVGVNLNAAQLACGTLTLTGALTGVTGMQFPAVQGWWSIQNLTTGNFTCACQAGASTEIIYIPQGEIIDIQVNVNTVRYRNLGRVGSYLDLATATVPAWITTCTIPPYLFCDGSSFNASTYPTLNQLIGTNVLPDLRGRSRATVNSGTNRITTAGSGINGDALLAAGGVQNITIVQANLPNFTMPVAINDPGHFHAMQANPENSGTNLGQVNLVPIGGGSTVLNGMASQVTGITTNGANTGGSSTPLTNMPPAAIAGITLIRAG